MAEKSQASLHGLRLVAFESRRAHETAELIRRYGGEPFIAPALREVPLGQNNAALELVDRLEAGEVDLVIFLTGVGTRTLAEAVETRYSRSRLVGALRRAKTLARGPKPVAALKELGLTPNITVPEPNTWREILTMLDANLSVRGRRVAVQEYGVTNRELIVGLEARGATVVRVPVYRWALPEDTAPLRAAIREIAGGRVDVALFTNATQVDHMFQVAVEENLDSSLRHAFRRVLIASIGPICTEALRHHGLGADFEPRHPKLGHLVAEAARAGPTLLRAKRAKPPGA